MENATNPLQSAMACDLVQIGFEILAFGPAASHDALKRVVGLIGEREQMAGFAEHVRLIDIGLKVYGFHHVQSFRSHEVVGHPERPIEPRNCAQPRVAKQIQIPKMLVGVYDLHGMICVVEKLNRRKISRNEKLLPYWPTPRP